MTYEKKKIFVPFKAEEELEKAKAEIWRLSNRNHKCIYLSDDETTEYCVDGPCPKFKTESQIKAEAIKEFAERLKKNEGRRGVPIATIDNIVKEMVGDTE